jgi:hypothetical protein
MGSAKPWQIVVLVAAVVAVAASVYFTFGTSGDRPQLISEITMVDVASGDLFVFSLGGKKGVSVPETNPDTGKRTLMPVLKSEDGSWSVGPRDLSLLKMFEKEPKLCVNASTGKVTPSGTAPRKVR